MTNARRSYILATSGHVDHGKSALVQALTGIDPDRLPEEKARGMTIDLGFAHLALDAGDGATLDVGVIDVPGHEDFVKNMVAGVSSIDAALLVVAADDGWMPQTEEHLQILTYLGVRRAVVALTKIDLASDEQALRRTIRERLSGSPFAEAAIVSTSVKTGGGIDDLRRALSEVLRGAEPQADVGKPRLWVDRAFSVRGAGTVVTGTLTGGSFHRNDPVIVQPAKIAGHIRAIQNHGADVATVAPGSRVALNIPEVRPLNKHDRRHSQSGVGRGDVVTVADAGKTTRRLDVGIVGSNRDEDAQTLRAGLHVEIHYGTAAVGARLNRIERAQSFVVARMALDAPVLAMLGDRGIIRNASQTRTLAGFVVLDPDPPRSSLIGSPARERGQERLAMLAARAAAPSDARVAIVSQVRTCGFIARGSIAAALNISDHTFQEHVLSAAREGAIVCLDNGNILARRDEWEALLDVAVRLIDAHHQSHPEQRGLAIDELRAHVKRRFPRRSDEKLARRIFESLVAGLSEVGFVISETFVARAGHQIALPPRLAPAGETIRRRLAEHPFDPPSRKDLAANDAAYQALRFLIASGEVVEIGPEAVLSDANYRRAVTSILEHLNTHGPATVATLKTMLGSSRRIVVPLLERTDRDGYTRRVGDTRVPGNKGGPR